MTAREQQQRLAAALTSLLGHDLPTAYSWRFYQDSTELNGQIIPSQGPAGQRLADLLTWADFLDTDIKVTRYDNNTGGAAAVTGEYEGVRVKVWSAFPLRELPKTPGGDR